ncbi:thioredoxin family protein [Candidatus Peregrinibacteria bacterium CG11_big_fil_rev_8_21_14_0_20_46_8]|nr:MAG: thioredoxin family protein [Candidatus Peregrinibacteria bacterium CG11_big_fil_rev_8_21_14_0_20_46_8]
MALAYSESIPFGEKAPDFNLSGIDGRAYSLASFKDAKVLVVIFMCNHCPYVQAAWDRLVALQSKYEDKGVQFVGINSNDSESYPEDSFAKMKEYAAEKNHNFPYLEDSTQEVAKAYKATCTPDIFAYDEGRGLAYHGRINDNWQEPENVTRHELDEALAAMVEGREVSKKQNPSMGCSIKWKK